MRLIEPADLFNVRNLCVSFPSISSSVQTNSNATECVISIWNLNAKIVDKKGIYF